MKRVIFAIYLSFYCLSSFSQVEALKIKEVSNSVENLIDSAITYSYNTSTQTHNYSGNWDFDGDGYTDSLFFVGTGGAHLYFYLRIVLSSDSLVRNFPSLELDMPVLGSIDDLKKVSFYPPPYSPFFVVDHFSSTIANDTIYLCLDNQSQIAKKWRDLGVNSHYVLLSFEDGKMILSNFIK